MEFPRLKALLHTLVQEGKTPSVDCIVCQNHRQLFRYTEGMADREARRPIRGDERYLIFSMTKLLTCVAALQLLEQGKYALDDPVSRFLPEFSAMRIADTGYSGDNAAQITSGQHAGGTGTRGAAGYARNPITVRHLFSMSAGLDYDLSAPALQQAQREGKTSTREMAGALSRTVLGFEPGTRFRYSLCHDVLGALIEIWSGMGLGAYLEAGILEPLGMKNTFFGAGKDNRMALYRAEQPGVLQRIPLENPYSFGGAYESGGAGLTSCTEDYAIFLDALACGGVGKNESRILSEATVKLLAANQLTGIQLEDLRETLLCGGYGYGLGVRVHLDPAASGSLSPVGEFGWDGAAGSFSLVDPENRLSLTYFQHTFNWERATVFHLRNALYQDFEGEKP